MPSLPPHDPVALYDQLQRMRFPRPPFSRWITVEGEYQANQIQPGLDEGHIHGDIEADFDWQAQWQNTDYPGYAFVVGELTVKNISRVGSYTHISEDLELLWTDAGVLHLASGRFSVLVTMTHAGVDYGHLAVYGVMDESRRPTSVGHYVGRIDVHAVMALI